MKTLFSFFNNLAKCVTLPKRVANGTIPLATARTCRTVTNVQKQKYPSIDEDVLFLKSGVSWGQTVMLGDRK